MQKTELETFCPTSRLEWRDWLLENHSKKQSVWLVQYKKGSNIPTISWSEAVDEALCFGWIDSKKIAIDNQTTHQFFSRRKAKSTWSKINKDKVERLVANGLIAEAGLQAIDIAKQNGSWIILDDVEQLLIPQDLITAFKTREGSTDYFLSLSKSVRKSMLQWIVLAKRPETRQNRINELTQLAAQKLKPKQF